jgi:predicted enzyme related to lactoylglutathione lyase
MKVKEVAFYGYPVTELKRARAFYESVLGLTRTRLFGNEEQGWMEYDIGPATLSIGNMAPDWKPNAGGGSIALEVEDIDAAVNEVRTAGHPVSFGPFETEVCFIACVLDPDGNSITLHQRKPSAA